MKIDLKGNFGYALVFATYWMSYCVIASFSSVFLLANGYSNTEIGLLIAIGNLISVVIQPFLANLADRSKKATVFEISMVATTLIMLFAFFTLILHGRSIPLFLAYLLMFAIHASLQPLLNSMDMTLAHRNIKVDYGICRSMGSLGYSAISALLSFLLVRVGTASLPVVCEACTAALIGGLVLLNLLYKGRATGTGTADTSNPADLETSAIPERPAEEADAADAVAAGQAQSEAAELPGRAPTTDITMKEFISRHKLFLLMTFGIFLLFYDHQIINFFMLQVFRHVGGDSAQMGTYYSIMTLLEIPPLFCFTLLTRRFSTSFLLRLATIGLVLRSLVMLAAHTSFLMMLTLATHPFGFPLFLPTIVRYIDEIMNRGERVRGQSLYIIVITISGVVATATGGIILDSLGAGPLLWICAVTCVIGAAVILPLVERVRRES